MHQRKPFTIELRRGPGEVPDPAPPVEQVGLVDISRKIDDLAGLVRPSAALAANLAEAYRREVEDVLRLRDELAGIREAIRETKRHVVSFHASVGANVTVHRAADELGAVVADTEGATNNILAAAERIEMLAGVVQSETSMEAMSRRAGEIAQVAMSIYEACNFQDLTGQRIARVCETLAFVEERVERMTDIWGGLDQLSHVLAQEAGTMAARHDALGTHALAAGPAVVGADGHVDQDDIDALFD